LLLLATGALAFPGALLQTTEAHAQTLPDVDDRVPETPSNGDGMDTHLFRPAVDSKGFFYVNGTDLLEANSVNFGLILDWGHKLMRTKDDSTPVGTNGEECTDTDCTFDPQSGTGTSALIQDSFQGTLTASYGIANVAIVGLSAPIIIMSGDRAYQIGDNEKGLYNSGQLEAQKLSSLIPHVKVRLLRVNEGIGLGVAFVGQVGFPIADSPRDLGGDPGFWYWPRVALEKRFGENSDFRLALDVGYRGHTGDNPRFGVDTNNQVQLEEGELTYGDLVTYGLGASYRVSPKLDLVVESYGSYLTSSNTAGGQKLSNEFLGGLKLFVERNSYLMLAGGSRAFSTGFEAADARVVVGFMFEPSIGDRDGDGIMDDQDACPDDPEDKDGFEDSDGCPEPDNDEDGILDVDDRCPNVAEDKDGDEDSDGCPEGDKIKDRDGDGIPDSEDKCPDVPEDKDGFEDQDGCPEKDNDKDGIPDTQDGCPDVAEDKDNFEDDDGCPEPDNDRDQIPDVEDKCPLEPETYNGKDDEDGCPDKGRVVIEGDDIVILDKINFATGSAEILPGSLPIVEAVASTLKGHPEFLVLEIAGHADERGDDDSNLKLTQARAASVREALESRGIEGQRLVSQGYGEYCPLEVGYSPKAWDKNRRVEFKVVKTEDGQTNVQRGCEIARNKGVFPPRVP
jgi:outer membrane protein OmpA-like peptidoglycan-associated protein